MASNSEYSNAIKEPEAKQRENVPGPRTQEPVSEQDERTKFLNEEIEALDKVIAKGGDATGELGKMRFDLEGQIHESTSQAMLETKFHLLGMDELVPGVLWKGSHDQIEKAIEQAQKSSGRFTSEQDPDSKRWKLTIDGREVQMQEVAETSRPKPADESRTASNVPGEEPGRHAPAQRPRAPRSKPAEQRQAQEAEGRLMAAATHGIRGATGVEASIEAIQNVYKRLESRSVDQDLAECFRITAEKMFDSGNVHILPAKNRLAVIRDAIGNVALAQEINNSFAKEGTLGLHTSHSGALMIFLRERDGSRPRLRPRPRTVAPHPGNQT
jgi:hypothetical protein